MNRRSNALPNTLLHWLAGLGAAMLLSLVATVSHAADPAQLSQIQTLQNDFVANNGGALEEQLVLESNSAQLQAQFALINQIEGQGNRATLSQVGTGNTAAILQGFGNDNTVTMKQTGNYNYGTVTQAGSGNRVDNLLQQGDYNWVAVSQSGNGNQITDLIQSGNHNTATANQYNGGNTLSLTQSYDYNAAQIDQYGGTNVQLTQSNPNGSSSSVNSVTIKAYVEPGANPNFAPVTVSGAGTMVVTLCNAYSSASTYCSGK